MSCVDAAIIKALVEHIGMDPEDVPVGGGHDCVKYTAGEGIAISGDNVISSTNACKCTADIPINNIQFGTVNKDGTDYLSISRVNSGGFMTVGDMIITEEISTGKRNYHLCISIAHSAMFVQFLNTTGHSPTDYTLSNYTITTPLKSAEHRLVGVVQIRSAETLNEAFKLFMKWTMSKFSDLS